MYHVIFSPVFWWWLQNSTIHSFTLTVFLTKIITATRIPTLIGSLGRAIVQAASPKSLLAPLQFGLATQITQQFASRYFNDTLYTHEIVPSYDCVQNFTRTAAAASGSGLGVLSGDSIGVEFVADNVDHNQVTTDGYNTLHAMGVLAVCIPRKRQLVKIALQTRVPAGEMKTVYIRPLPNLCTGLSKRVNQ